MMAPTSESFWVSLVTTMRSLVRPLRMIWAWAWLSWECFVDLLIRSRKKVRSRVAALSSI